MDSETNPFEEGYRKSHIVTRHLRNLIRKWCPDDTEEQLEEAAENYRRYLAIVWNIAKRNEGNDKAWEDARDAVWFKSSPDSGQVGKN